MLNEEEKKKIRLMKNEYHKKWVEQNPEKAQAIYERFWRKKIAEQENRKDD